MNIVSEGSNNAAPKLTQLNAILKDAKSDPQPRIRTEKSMVTSPFNMESTHNNLANSKLSSSSLPSDQHYPGRWPSKLRSVLLKMCFGSDNRKL